MVRISDALGQEEIALTPQEQRELQKEIVRQRAILVGTQDIRTSESMTSAVHTGIAFVLGGVLAGILTGLLIGRKK